MTLTPPNPIRNIKVKTATDERENLRMELKSLFAKKRIDVHVQTDKELVSLWIARLELRGAAPGDIEDRFRATTGENLALTRTGFEIGRQGSARHGGDQPSGRGTDSFVSPKTLMALAKDIHSSGNTPGAHHITVRSGHQYVVFKTPSGPAGRTSRRER